VWEYKLASSIPPDGSATYDEIAAASRLSRPLVARTIRAAMTLNIFDETEPGRIRHTAISRLLATEDGYYDAVGLQLEDIGPASMRLIEAWEKFGHDAGEPDQSAFSLHNSGRSLFTVLAEEPERARRFDSAMKYCVEDKDFSFSDASRAFDWSVLDRPGSRVVDLGGGYGQISEALAKQTRHLSFTVQDLPHVVEQGREKLPSEFEDRITFQVHDFMELQPHENPPDAFLISRCLHNWSDHHCSIILRSLRPALRRGSRVLIWDSVLDDRPAKKLSERFNLQQDFIMATISNGKDRSAEEFGQVLELSDERFKIEGIRRPKGCKLSMIEVSWNG
jgi:ubiquinone/menaquinone biosynthesis C-methylase UbiE